MDGETSFLGSALMREAWMLFQVVSVAALAGWVASRLLDPGITTRGLPLLAGLFGVYVGSWILEQTGWPSGPTLAGESIAAALAGALGICGFIKLVSLGAAGPRW